MSESPREEIEPARITLTLPVLLNLHGMTLTYNYEYPVVSHFDGCESYTDLDTYSRLSPS